MNNYLLSDSDQGSLFNGKNVNCSAKISTLSHVATCTEVPVYFLPLNPLPKKAANRNYPEPPKHSPLLLLFIVLMRQP